MRSIVKIICLGLALILMLSLVGCVGEKVEYRLHIGSYKVEGGVAYAAVLTDTENRIVLARIDEIELSDSPVSKKVMGDAYGMKEAGALGEWYEEVMYLERALIGKSYDELVKVKTGDPELTAGCTITVEGLVAAVGAAFLDEGVTVSADAPLIALTLAAVADGDGYIVSGGAVALYRGYTLGQRTEIRKENKNG